MSSTTILRTAGACAVAAASMFLAVPQASADGGPTARELLDACNTSTDVCDFHPSGPPEEFTGPGHQVGQTTYNCTQDLQRSTISWSDTTGESNSVGVALTAEYGFAEVFKVSLQVSYNHTWESSHTDSQATNVDVRPGEKGWVERAPRMQRVSGTYEMHFPDRFYDHYIWYQDFTAEGPLPGGTDDITQHTAPMTDQERAEHCG